MRMIDAGVPSLQNLRLEEANFLSFWLLLYRSLAICVLVAASEVLKSRPQRKPMPQISVGTDAAKGVPTATTLHEALS